MKFNLHIEKYKAGDIGGIQAEQFRQYKNIENYKNDVRQDKSQLNVYHRYHDEDWKTTISRFQKEHKEKVGKGIRKDAVIFDSIVQSVPASWNYELTKLYFEESERFLKRYLLEVGVDQDAFLSAVTHYDETSPHQTFVFCPKKDGKFENKNIMTKDFLKNIQKKAYENYLNFSAKHPELEVLESYLEDNGRKHLNELDNKIQWLESKNNQLLSKNNTLEYQNKRLLEENEAFVYQHKQLNSLLTTLEPKLAKIRAELEEYAETTNNVMNRTYEALNEQKTLTLEMPIDEINEIIARTNKEPKETGKVFRDSGSKVLKWEFSPKWLIRLRNSVITVANWVNELLSLGEYVRPTEQEKEVLDKQPKSLDDQISEALNSVQKYHQNHHKKIDDLER